jgi:hypothetical protein
MYDKNCKKKLKKIKNIECNIHKELEKVKILLTLLNCENLENIKPLLKTIFSEIERLEKEAADLTLFL